MCAQGEAIIIAAWNIYLRKMNNISATDIVDEDENSLHLCGGCWEQRSIDIDAILVTDTFFPHYDSSSSRSSVKALALSRFSRERLPPARYTSRAMELRFCTLHETK